MLKAKMLYAFICTVLYALLVYHNHKQNNVVNFTTFNRLGFSASVANYKRLSEWPLQFLRTGSYNRSYGSLLARTPDGHWWSDTAGSATTGRYLRTWTGDVRAQSNAFRGLGFALRWVVSIRLILLISAWITLPDAQ